MGIEPAPGADLGSLSSFGLAAQARELVELGNHTDLSTLLDTPLELLILGGGSNTIFVGDFDGRVILNRRTGVRIEAMDRDRVLVEAAAGENWHELVDMTVRQDLWGLENLALIPGAVGAAPMQNIGAYGVELADVLDAVQVFDRSQESTRWLAADDCELGYRSSRFKRDDRFVILAIRLVLQRHAAPRLDYPDLAEAVAGNPRWAETSPEDIAAAVIHVRTRKLPDPSTIPNAGSFFKNPVVSARQADELIERFPELPSWTTDAGIKLSAAWMIDQLGWRGRQVGGAQVYPKHALVLTNAGGATGQDLLNLARAIRNSVGERFGVRLEPEPRLVGGAL